MNDKNIRKPDISHNETVEKPGCRSRAWLLTPLFGWMVLIFIVSSIPGEKLPPVEVINADKLAHIAVFGVLGFLARRAFERSKGQAGSFWIVVVLCALYGISDEIHQMFVPGRSPSVLDTIADAVGALAGVFLWDRLKRRKSNTE